MKILAIRGKNLASLEGDFNIDFTQEPLKSAGIFAISGSTGSGKSTILDALCLALYDNTPRTNSAGENISIRDVNESKINQRDSRTILRRGTAEGYAAAQFISLNGDQYLSEWSVRRARGKAEGSLQGVEMRLTNLSTGIEEQGTKTELLAKIVDLTGLSFEQFTRAVLLAQGDFATFLKAKKGEKAQLLEKLTGTDIYSRISIAIYEKSKESQEELKVLEDKIKETELLSPEQLESFSKEKENLEIEIELLEKEIKTVLEKLKWIADNNTISTNLDKSKKELVDIEEIIKIATPNFELIAQYNNFQEIRDPFNELEVLKKEISLKRESKLNLKKEIEIFEKLIEDSSKKLIRAKEEKERFLSEYNSTLPQIKKATELDLSFEHLKREEREATKELKIAQEKIEISQKEIKKIELEFESTKKEIDNHQSVLSKQRRFESIILRQESLNNYLEDYTTAAKMADNFTNLKEKSLKFLVTQKELLKSLKERVEILNKMLPVEVTVLREKLHKGEPCPVCGSIDHPFTHSSLIDDTSQQTLQEEQINREKKELALQIERTEDTIKITEKEAISAEASAIGHSQTKTNLTASIDNILGEIADWKIKLEEKVLQSGLLKLYSLWDRHTKELTNGQEKIKKLEVVLGLENQNYKAVYVTLIEKQERASTLTKQTEAVASERKSILNGESVQATELFYSKRSKEIEESIEKADILNKSLEVEKSSKEGVISQVLEEITKSNSKIDTLFTTINQWIHSYNNTNATLGKVLTYEQAANVLLTPINIIKETQKEILGLTDAQKILKATVAERQNNFDNHQKEPSRPNLNDSYETTSSLKTLVESKDIILKEARNKQIAVHRAIENHKENRAKTESYIKEINKREGVSLNWRKLNELYGSANGSKFKEIAQGYTLDALLTYANIHLKELSGRYELQKIEETLGLQVADLDMMGEVRTVHSLSGGESFLISLALALGLSSLSSSKMKIESLFIDEGFGSLDIDTLRTALDALERLQTMGRKIGVISHVAEMTERVGVQIKVNKIVNGRSRIEICH